MWLLYLTLAIIKKEIQALFLIEIILKFFVLLFKYTHTHIYFFVVFHKQEPLNASLFFLEL